MDAWKKIFIAIFMGGLFGIFLPQYAHNFQFLGTAFFSIIKMLICPLVLFAIIYGVTSINKSGEGIRRLSIKALIAFFITASFAACIGIFTTKIMEPGKNGLGLMHEIDSSLSIQSNADNKTGNYKYSNGGRNEIKDAKSNDNDSKSGKDKANHAPQVAGSAMNLDLFLKMIISTNIFESLANARILQIVVFAFFVGAVLQANRSKFRSLIMICRQTAHLFFRMIGIVMQLAPYGVFGYVYNMIAHEGLKSFATLGYLILTIMVACLIQYMVFGIMIACIARVSPIPFYRKMLDVQMAAFSTSSSKATLISLMETSEKSLGVSKHSARFLLPLSAALNMDGGAIYQASVAVFFAQVYNIHFDISTYAVLIFMSTIASIGAAGVPSGVLLFLSMVLSSVGLPLEGIALIVSIDRILDMITTTLNVTGDACVTLALDASENTFDKECYYDMNKVVRK